MTPALSLYLDLVRLFAAIIVLLHHVWPTIFPNNPLPWPGHEAVVVFFVLSGYVIAYSTKSDSFSDYFVSRSARVLSVVVPALLLSLFVASDEPVKYASATENFWHNWLLNATFMAQSFGFNAAMPYNGPFWSICYEVWYYAIFAAWVFSPTRLRVLVTLAAIVVAGLKIVALLPVWLLGVALFRYMPKFSPRFALALFLGTGLAGFVFFYSGASHAMRGMMSTAFPEFMLSLGASNQFIGDYILGIIVTFHFAAVASMDKALGWMQKGAKQIRFASSFTFSTYLYHMPLTVLLWNVLGVSNPATFLCLLVALIVALGAVTERKAKVLRNVLSQPKLRFES